MGNVADNLMDFFKRVLNAQLSVTLLAGIAATLLRWENSIPPEVWKDVINTCLLSFVGGGFLKDGLLALAQRPTTDAK